MVPEVKTFSFESTSKGIRAYRKEKPFMNMKRLHEIGDHFENAFPDGLFTNPNGKVPNIRFRDMFEWCQEHGRTPESLTKEELAQFRAK